MAGVVTLAVALLEEQELGHAANLFTAAPSNRTIMITSSANTKGRVGGGQPLLVVEDDPEVLNLEVQVLRRLGYKVLQAPGPVEALRLAVVTPVIDLLLTNFEMPEANGLELAARFQALHPKTPVVIVSDLIHRAQGSTFGLDRFASLKKPFLYKELVDKVYCVLSCQKHAVQLPSPPSSPIFQC